VLLRNEAKVGLLVFAAIVALIGMYWFLRGFSLGAATFEVYAVFTDARKLDKGADIRVAGVKVGSVSEIRLTGNSLARVDMIIWNSTCIPADSVARITTGGFIGDSYVDILPGVKRGCLRENQRIRSSEPMNYEKLVSDIGGLVGQLKVSVEGINAVLGDKNTIANIKETVKQLGVATDAATKLLASAQGLVTQASPDVRKTVANMAQATDNAVKITKELQLVVKNDAAPNVHEILGKANEAMTSLNASMAQAKDIMTKLGGSAGKLDGSMAKVDSALTKIDDAAQQTDEMMKNLNSATGDIKEITSDKDTKTYIKDTMRNAAEATAQANALLCNINRKLGGFTKPAGTRKAEIPNNGFVTDSLWNTTEGDYRFDANYTLGGPDSMFFRLGAFNVGENTRANLQLGHILSASSSLRYGIYASRVGFGIDKSLGKYLLLSADGFRPNDPQYDLRAVLRMNGGFGLYGGYSNVFQPKGDAFVGFQYSK
jgi:phospholipid/cholesterol/gamma-HCH transport system substrate-binding protein